MMGHDSWWAARRSPHIAALPAIAQLIAQKPTKAVARHCDVRFMKKYLVFLFSRAGEGCVSSFENGLFQPVTMTVCAPEIYQ